MHADTSPTNTAPTASQPAARRLPANVRTVAPILTFLPDSLIIMPNKTGLIAGIAGGLVIIGLVLGVGGFVWPGFFTGPDEGPSIEANATVDALNSHDTGKIDALFCPGHDSTRPGDVEVLATTHVQATRPTATLKAPPTVAGATATATAHLAMTNSGRKYAFDLTVTITRRAGVWCVSDLAQVTDSLTRG